MRLVAVAGLLASGLLMASCGGGGGSDASERPSTTSTRPRETTITEKTTSTTATPSTTTEATTTTEPEPSQSYADPAVKVVVDGWTYGYRLVPGVLSDDFVTVDKSVAASPPGEARIVVTATLFPGVSQVVGDNPNGYRSPDLGALRPDTPGRVPPALPVSALGIWPLPAGLKTDLHWDNPGCGVWGNSDNSYFQCNLDGNKWSVESDDAPEAVVDAIVAATSGPPTLHVQFKSSYYLNEECAVRYLPNGEVQDFSGSGTDAFQNEQSCEVTHG